MLVKFKRYKQSLTINEMVVSDKADRQALTKIRKCATQIVNNFGFFADLLFSLKLMEVPKDFCDTMCTDGKAIGYCADFVKKLSEEEVVFVIIHELMHNANFHFNRQGGRDPRIWNYAGDYAINLLIDDMTKDSKIISTPKDILLDQKYRDMGAEQIYEIIIEKQKEKQGQGKSGQGQGQGQGKSGQGQGQGKPGQGEGGDNIIGQDIKPTGSIEKVGEEIFKDQEGTGNSEVENAKNAQELENVWKKIRQQASTRSQGVGSGGMDRWIKKANKAKVNWKSELKKFINSALTELDYAFFNKRFIHKGVYLPGPKNIDKSMFSDVVIAIDTSGSITQETLDKFGAELLKLFGQFQIERCYVIWCDSDIPSNGVQTFNRIDSSFKLEKLRPVGGGGTSFKPPFEWVYNNLLKKGRQPAFFLYFTDAYGSAPTPSQYGIAQYIKRIMWIVTDNLDASNLKFGKKIYLDKNNV
ncbi:VWA-like domain-containing protein [Candidatus Woesearchaeota archaeon]|nr:VWA-like domain-containing protein [Candidatus Woesearchaeota archaeon]MCF7901749.1 VWA-like domain-containing protein [Candidatus Woesearchaeota archaeon]